MLSPSTRTVRRGLLVLGVILIAANLRPALASVGPLIGAIRDATGLSNAALGVLTTLPLLAFGIVSTLTPLVTKRIGVEGALTATLVLVGLGTAVRSMPSVALLYFGTALFGVGIALGNVLLPTLVKRDFPDQSGSMTGLYSSVMGLGAAAAAGTSVPLAASLGWRGSLAFWAVPAVIGLIVWLPQLKGSLRTQPRRSVGAALSSLGRSRLAWEIALFMGLQSLTFYVILAWLPDLLQSRGLGAAEAGWLLALSQALGIAGSAVVPAWASKRRDQRSVIVALGVLEAVAIGGLFLPDALYATFWVSLLGFVLGGTFGLALLFLVLRTPDAETATELSGMAQSAGYLLAATGPAGFGWLHDLTHGWTLPLVLLLGMVAAKVAVGLGAGKPAVIERG